MEGDLHAVPEGMLIAGYAVGATKGYIYVRAKYPLAIKRLQIALQQAREQGLAGKNRVYLESHPVNVLMWGKQNSIKLQYCYTLPFSSLKTQLSAG